MELKTCLAVLFLATVAAAQIPDFFRVPGTTRQQPQRQQQQPQRQQQQPQRQQQQPRQQQQREESRQQQPQRQEPRQQPDSGRVDDRNGRSAYHFSWRHGQSGFTGEQAISYCSGLGGSWQAVSINDKDEDDFVSRVLAGERQSYTWTGGFLSQGGFKWQDGSRVDYANWSHTGGRDRPQPDGQGGEKCLGVLNNFYQDGIKWHDIGCFNRKPVICERRA